MARQVSPESQTGYTSRKAYMYVYRSSTDIKLHTLSDDSSWVKT